MPILRFRTVARTAAASALALAALVAAGRAQAEEEFDVSVSGGHVVVTAKGKWHINKDYPWRLTIGKDKLDKSRFVLSEGSASVEAPKGTGEIRGGVCNGDQCLRLQRAVTIP